MPLVTREWNEIMMDSKTRAVLRSRANTLPAVLQIGVNGITDGFIKQVDEELFCRELVKINVLKTSSLDAKQVLNDLAIKLKAEPIAAIGFKIVLYRVSNKKGIKHILEV